jgi:hypothetical protein
MRLRLHVGGRPVVAFFSGDTIVDAAAWGDGGNALPRLFARHVFALAAAERRADPAAAVYWYLISSGYKTYRFLPISSVSSTRPITARRLLRPGSCSMPSAG